MPKCKRLLLLQIISAENISKIVRCTSRLSLAVCVQGLCIGVNSDDWSLEHQTTKEVIAYTIPLYIPKPKSPLGYAKTKLLLFYRRFLNKKEHKKSPKKGFSVIQNKIQLVKEFDISGHFAFSTFTLVIRYFVTFIDVDSLKRGYVNENIFARFIIGNESKTFRPIEKFNCSSHLFNLKGEYNTYI